MKIRKLQLKDAPLMLEWMHDSSINYWFQFDGNTKTLADAEAYVKTAGRSKDELHYAITDDSDEYLGTVSLKSIDKDGQKAEYAICLRGKAQGMGAAEYATRRILEIGFEELGLSRVYLNVLTENLRANKFYSKFGWVYEGEFRKGIRHRGELKDLKWYSILREEYYDNN